MNMYIDIIHNIQTYIISYHIISHHITSHHIIYVYIVYFCTGHSFLIYHNFKKHQTPVLHRHTHTYIYSMTTVIFIIIFFIFIFIIIIISTNMLTGAHLTPKFGRLTSGRIRQHLQDNSCSGSRYMYQVHAIYTSLLMFHSHTDDGKIQPPSIFQNHFPCLKHQRNCINGQA